MGSGKWVSPSLSGYTHLIPNDKVGLIYINGTSKYLVLLHIIILPSAISKKKWVFPMDMAQFGAIQCRLHTNAGSHPYPPSHVSPKWVRNHSNLRIPTWFLLPLYLTFLSSFSYYLAHIELTLKYIKRILPITHLAQVTLGSNGQKRAKTAVFHPFSTVPSSRHLIS